MIFCWKEGDILLEAGRPVGKGDVNKSYTCAAETGRRIAVGDLLSILEDEECGVAYAKHMKYVESVWRMLEHDAARRLAFQRFHGVELRQWQKDLELELEGVADDRKILWYCDADGGAGKTFFYELFDGEEEGRCVPLRQSRG